MSQNIQRGFPKNILKSLFNVSKSTEGRPETFVIASKVFSSSTKRYFNQILIQQKYFTDTWEGLGETRLRYLLLNLLLKIHGSFSKKN